MRTPGPAGRAWSWARAPSMPPLEDSGTEPPTVSGCAPVPVHEVRFPRRSTRRTEWLHGTSAHCTMPSSRPAGQSELVPPTVCPSGSCGRGSLYSGRGLPPGHATHKTNTRCAHAPVQDTCSSYMRHAVRWRSHDESRARLFHARFAQPPPRAAATRHSVAVGVDGGLLKELFARNSQCAEVKCDGRRVTPVR